jgi:hypothetical protein
MVEVIIWLVHSVVGISIGYGLDGPGIESRWGRDFPHLSRPALGTIQPPVQWVLGLSRGKERPGHDADPSTPFQCRGHERVELYFYSLYGPYGLYRASVPVQGCTLHDNGTKQMPREKKACVTALYHTWIWNRNIVLKMFISNYHSLISCIFFLHKR